MKRLEQKLQQYIDSVVDCIGDGSTLNSTYLSISEIIMHVAQSNHEDDILAIANILIATLRRISPESHIPISSATLRTIPQILNNLQYLQTCHFSFDLSHHLPVTKILELIETVQIQHCAVIILGSRINKSTIKEDLVNHLSSRKRKHSESSHVDGLTQSSTPHSENLLNDIFNCLDIINDSSSSFGNSSMQESTMLFLALEALCSALSCYTDSISPVQIVSLETALSNCLLRMKGILANCKKCGTKLSNLSGPIDDARLGVVLALCRIVIVYPQLSKQFADVILDSLKMMGLSINTTDVVDLANTEVSLETITSWMLTNDMSNILCYLLSTPLMGDASPFGTLKDVWNSLSEAFKVACLQFACSRLRYCNSCNENFLTIQMKELLELGLSILVVNLHSADNVLTSLSRLLQIWINFASRAFFDLQLRSVLDISSIMKEISYKNVRYRGYEITCHLISAFISQKYKAWNHINKFSLSQKLDPAKANIGQLIILAKQCLEHAKSVIRKEINANNSCFLKYLISLRCFVCYLHLISATPIPIEFLDEIESIDVICITHATSSGNILSLSSLRQLSTLLAVIFVHNIYNEDEIVQNSIEVVSLTKWITSFFSIYNEMKLTLLNPSPTESQESFIGGGNIMLLIETMSKVVNLVCITHPRITVCVLGEIITLWSLMDNNNHVMYSTFEALQSVLRTSPMSVSSALCLDRHYTADRIIIPILRHSETKDFKYTKLVLEMIFQSMDNFSYSFGNIVLSRILITRDGSLSNRLREVRDFLSENDFKLRSYFDPRSVFNENPLFLLDAITCEDLKNYTEEDLIRGKLNSFLEEICRVFDIHLPICISTGAMQQLLSVIVPALGLSHENQLHHQAVRALRIYSVLYNKKTMVVGKMFSNKNDVIEDNVAEALPSFFLYIMASIIQKDWTLSEISTCQMQERVNALKVIVSMLRQSDLSKFIPKILFFIDTAFASSGVYVHLCIADFMDHFLSFLSPKSLLENLQALVVSLYPFIEPNDRDIREANDVFDQNNLIEFAPLKYALSHFEPYGRTFLVSKALSLIFEASLPEIRLLVSAKARNLAIESIRNLFLNRFLEFKEHVTSIPYIPKIVELTGISAVYEEEMQSLSFEQKIKKLCESVNHESIHVRLAVLKQIRHISEDMRTEIYKILTMKESSIGSMTTKDITSILLEALLNLCSIESSPIVLEECALCLGCIGAIDPARVQVLLGASILKSELPWKLNEVRFAYSLLSEHVIPSLKAASGSYASVQDRVSVAIQELLEFLAVSSNPTYCSGQMLPDIVSKELQQLGILDLCEPYLTSRYHLPFDTEELHYVTADNFDRWISLWCRHFIQNLEGPFKMVLTSCRGALRSRSALAQYLLPHLVVNILTFQINKRAENTLDITTEILRVLQMTPDSSSSVNLQTDHMCVQAIFSLMDTLEGWLLFTIAEVNRSKSGETSKARQFIEVIQPLIDGVPKFILGEAALRVKSFARALRYFELDARSAFSRDRSNNLMSSIGRKDGSNGGLPSLSSEALSRLNQIYAYLGCNDAVQGVQYLRAVNGYSSSSWDKIIELESAGNLQEALIEYGLLKNCTTISTDRIVDSESITLEWAKVEKGRLRCLLELGQADSVALQVDITSTTRFREKEIENALLPLSIEASWQLQQWDQLDAALNRYQEIDIGDAADLPCDNDDKFQVYLGKVLSYVHRRDRGKLKATLIEARKDIIPALSAASMESYSRAYPFLAKLHILNDVETGLDFIQAENENVFLKLYERHHWDDRQRMIASSANMLSTQSRVCKTILGMCNTANSRAALAETWLQECKTSLSQSALAGYALRNALLHGIDADIALREECRILKTVGQTYKALTLLEPVPLDVRAVVTQAAQANLPPDKKRALADKLLLATQLMVESSQRHGAVIDKRFEAIENLHASEGAFFLHACYIDSLYSEMKTRVDADSSHSSSLRRTSQGYMADAIRLYCLSLRYGSKNAVKSLPKLLTLWFSISDTTRDLLKTSSSVDNISKAQSYVAKFIKESTSAPILYSSISQLVSRTGHPNKETIKSLSLALVKLLFHFPKQSIWHIAGMLNSSDGDRRATGKKIVSEAYKQLMEASRKNDAEMLSQADKFLKAFISLAQYRPEDPKDRKAFVDWSPPKDINLRLFVVPSQSALNMCILSTQGLCEQSEYFAGDHEFIYEFDTRVDILSSKEKPKLVKLTTSSGSLMKFLLKQERDGDLRKDARIMEFNHVVNRLLMEDPEGRSRALRLRTYSVVCLDEECGILEWVNNTRVLRLCILDSYSLAGKMPFKLDTDSSKAWVEMQNRNSTNIPALTAEYHETVLKNCKPCLHQWFLASFAEATKWLEAREAFCRSAAVWSAVGHVVGLGDRHSENILIDTINGECVFVDFDCLFDKGLQLSVPEIVPFRMTPNMVDAMGVMGVEGVYRRTMEVCLSTLRHNKESLVSILEPFLNDPTVAWARKGRAQISDLGASSRNSRSHRDNSAEAEETLRKIGDRLRGIYNLSHPKAALIIQACLDRNVAVPTKGLGAVKGDEFLLSVQGQVQRLIEEATAEENLAQMFHGWQPWL